MASVLEQNNKMLEVDLNDPAYYSKITLAVLSGYLIPDRLLKLNLFLSKSSLHCEHFSSLTSL